jgi:multimeric flavodoxin WrbA
VRPAAAWPSTAKYRSDYPVLWHRQMASAHTKLPFRAGGPSRVEVDKSDDDYLMNRDRPVSSRIPRTTRRMPSRTSTSDGTTSTRIPSTRRMIPRVLSDIFPTSLRLDGHDYAVCDCPMQSGAAQIGLRTRLRCTMLPMKIMAIDGSPHGESGNTTLLLERFVSGALEAGAEVERVGVHSLRIEPCCSRMACWYRTPGVCIHRDDISDIMPRLAEADAWVLSTPVHVGGMTESMVRFMERTVVLLSPMFEIHEGHTRHVASPYGMHKSVALISTCGYYEESAFESLVSQARDVTRSHHRRFAGALLRPHGLALRFMQANGVDVRDVLEAAHTAGVELATSGTFGDDTLRAVSRPLLSQEDFVAMMNSAFERRMGCRPGHTPGCA